MKIAFTQTINTTGNKREEITIGQSRNARTVISSVILEVESTSGITLKGAMNSATASELSAVSMKTLEAVNSISEPGIYMIPTEGINKLVLEITGATVVNVRGIY